MFLPPKWSLVYNQRNESFLCLKNKSATHRKSSKENANSCSPSQARWLSRLSSEHVTCFEKLWSQNVCFHILIILSRPCSHWQDRRWQCLRGSTSPLPPWSSPPPSASSKSPSPWVISNQSSEHSIKNKGCDNASSRIDRNGIKHDLQ